MFKEPTEHSLARIQLVGMLGISLLISLVFSFYFLWAQHEDFDSTLTSIKERVLLEQQNLLAKQIETIQNDLDYRRSNTELILRREIRQRVNDAYQIAESIYQKNRHTMSDQQIQSLIVESLRSLRFFEGRGYYFIDTLDGLCVLLPTAPKLEGTSLWDNRDPTGHYIMRGLVEATQNPQQAGFSRYYWYPPSERVMREKISYVRVFQPFNWVIGAGEYLYNVESDLRKEALQQLRSVRFGNDGYVVVFDQKKNLLVSPSRIEHEGKSPNQFTGLEKKSIDKILQQAELGNGLVKYTWYRPSSNIPTEKLSYVANYKPWGWTLLTGVYLDDVDNLMETQRLAMEKRVEARFVIGIVITIGVLFIATIFSWVFTRKMRFLIRRYQASLAQKNAELEENAKRLKLSAAVFESGSEAVMISDRENRIVTVNQPFTKITGYSIHEVIGKRPDVFSSGYHDSEFYRQMWETLKLTGQWDGEIWNRRKDGSIFPEWLRIATVKDMSGNIENYIATFSDISERKNAEEQIRHLAFYDPLTELPNRRLLMDRLQQALVHSEYANTHGAVLFLDLDNFKALNDTKGHDFGDLLLIEVAHRLKIHVRETDTVARLGGDEFVVMLEDLADDFALAVSEAEKMAKHLISVVQHEFNLQGYGYHCSCSIGASMFSGQHESIEELIKHADTAMYQAKAAGRNTARFFVPAMQAALESRLQLEAELRQGIQEGQLRVFYQVQMGLQQQVLGAEALVRWQHPERGMVSPAEFIPLAEETGLILPLGSWVLREACRQLAIWSHSPITAELQIAVNVSAKQFHQVSFVEEVRNLVTEFGFPPSRLKLELTESLLLDNIGDSIQHMQALRALGIQFSMDDFGTGYSSLTYIKRLPIDQLKIDQSFVRDLPADRDDEVIVQAIIAMAHSLRLEVIAEGVETEEQRAFLEAQGCYAFQGYLFGRPMPIEQLQTLLEKAATPSLS